MQKRIFICLLLVIALLVPTLASCGFGGSDALEIENIGVEVLEDGTSKITIKYFDDIEDPVVFYVPAGQIGEKGDAGEIGNGIKEIVLSNKENGVQTMYIHYTDENFPVTEVQVKDGTVVDEVTRVDKDGVAYMLVKLSDGSESLVELPMGVEGKEGTSIVGVNHATDNETNETIVTFTLSNGFEIGPIRIKPGNDGMNLTNEIIKEEVYDEETGKAIGVNLQFVLADGRVTVEKVFLPYGNDGVGILSVQREEVKDKNGTVIGTAISFIKTDGSVTESIVVRDGTGISDVSYKTLSNGKTEITLTLTDGREKVIELPAATSIKEIKQTVDENGDTVLTIIMTDPNVTPLTVTLQEANGIDYIISSESEDGTQYQLVVMYTNGQSQTVSFQKNSAWHKGNKAPADDLGHRGDYYFDQWNLIIYHKATEDRWDEIVNFHSFDMKVEIVFSINAALGEKWADDSHVTPNWTFSTLKVGQSFGTTEYQIPIPEKAGYVFAGWYTTRDPNFVINAPFTDMTVIPNTDKLVLYPVWERA